MPYNLSISTVQDKNKIASDKAYLVCLEIDVRNINTGVIDETLYLVHNTEDVTCNEQVYNAYSFSLDLSAEAGSQPSVTITIEDISRAIQQKMQEYGGGIGFYVRIIIVTEADLDLPPEMTERFEVTGATSSDYNITWILGTQNLLAQKFPNRRQLRDRCSWIFKGVECAYAGADLTCDYSLEGPNGCDAKANSLRFGGFPGIRANGMRYV